MSTPAAFPPDPSHPRDVEAPHEPEATGDGLGPLPTYSTTRRAAARTMLLAHVDEALGTDGVSADALGTSGRADPSRVFAWTGNFRKRVRPRRAVLAGLGAVTVVALIAGVSLIGGSSRDPASGERGSSVAVGREPALPMSAMAYTVPSPAASTDGQVCMTSVGTTADGDGLRYLLNPAAGGTDLPLTYSLVRTDNCLASGWPAASFIATTADSAHLTEAITVWGPGVDGLAAPTADNGVRATAVGEHPARVLVADWGVIESWTTREGTWGITAAGADEATVQRVAEAVGAMDGVQGLSTQLPGLQQMALPAPPSTTTSTFSAHYGAESTGDDLRPVLELDVSSARLPWPAWASTGPLEGTELVQIGGVTGWSVQEPDNAFGMVVWEVAPGVNALLRGQVGGNKDLTPFARTAEEVASEDPRILASDLDR